MAFDNLPDLGPMLMPGAAAYGDEFLALGRTAAASHRHELDIHYGPDFFQQLDVWMPDDEVPGGAPVIVFIHGGAFRNGHKEWIGAMAPLVTRLPAVLVSPNYRLVPQVRIPDAVEDCLAALDWVYRNIARYGGDPETVFVGGHSAGGHLASMLALRPADLMRRETPPSILRGCLALSSVFSLIRAEHAEGSPIARFWDQMVGDDALARAYSASTHVAPNRLPFYIALGDAEPSEVTRGNVEMAELAGDRGFLFEHHVFPGCDHFDAHRRTLDPEGAWIRTTRDMLRTSGKARR